MNTLQKKDLVQLEGGGIPPFTACGFAVGATVGAFIFSPLLGLYLTSKAIGVCSIEAAVV